MGAYGNVKVSVSNFAGKGVLGHDIVTLGNGDSTLQHQIVEEIAAQDPWLGMFGLDPAPTNYTTMNISQPNFLSTLKNE